MTLEPERNNCFKVYFRPGQVLIFRGRDRYWFVDRAVIANVPLWRAYREAFIRHNFIFDYTKISAFLCPREGQPLV